MEFWGQNEMCINFQPWTLVWNHMTNRVIHNKKQAIWIFVTILRKFQTLKNGNTFGTHVWIFNTYREVCLYTYYMLYLLSIIFWSYLHGFFSAVVWCDGIHAGITLWTPCPILFGLVYISGCNICNIYIGEQF